jgi:hypothetical protein
MSAWKVPASTGGQFMPCRKDIVDLIVGDARRIRNVPGRKTEVKDAE